MRVRTVLAGALVPAAGIGLATSAFASGGTVTLHLRAVHGNNYVQSGKTFIDTDADFNPAGQQIGADLINCVPTRNNQNSRCIIVIALRQGNLNGSFVETASGGISGRVTGGTRRLNGVGGTIRGRDSGSAAQLTVSYHH